eukprot:Em1211g2a
MMGSSISGGLFVTPLGPCSKSLIHIAELGVAYLLAELGEQVRRRQQLKPRRQKVPAAQRSEFQATTTHRQSGLCPRVVIFSQLDIKRATDCCSEFIVIDL